MYRLLVGKVAVCSLPSPYRLGVWVVPFVISEEYVSEFVSDGRIYASLSIAFQIRRQVDKDRVLQRRDRHDVAADCRHRSEQDNFHRGQFVENGRRDFVVEVAHGACCFGSLLVKPARIEIVIREGIPRYFGDFVHRFFFFLLLSQLATTFCTTTATGAPVSREMA